MSNANKVVQFLTDHKEGACDDCISLKTGITPRQQVNQICRALTIRRVLTRNGSRCLLCGQFKITNIRAHNQREAQSKEVTTKDPIEMTTELLIPEAQLQSN